MSDDPVDRPPGSPISPVTPDIRSDPTIWDPGVERLDEAECLRLIAPRGVGRLGYSGRQGVGVLPVLYRLEEGSILFRTALDSPTDEDLRTGIEGAAYKVSFEIDDVGEDAREDGWCSSRVTRTIWIQKTTESRRGRRISRPVAAALTSISCASRRPRLPVAGCARVRDRLKSSYQ
jgi:hypothetical protein